MDHPRLRSIDKRLEIHQRRKERFDKKIENVQKMYEMQKEKYDQKINELIERKQSILDKIQSEIKTNG
jgi:hypothetical protein